MSKTKVNRGSDGKYKIKGKDNKSVDLTLETTDHDNFDVYVLDGTDLNDKLPSSNPLSINWFAGFSIYDKKKGGDASVKYSFPVTLAANQRYFMAYDDANGVPKAYEVTDEIKNSGKVTLSKGDPAAGSVP